MLISCAGRESETPNPFVFNTSCVLEDESGAAVELLESGAAIIILTQYTGSVRETLLMAGAEAV